MESDGEIEEDIEIKEEIEDDIDFESLTIGEKCSSPKEDYTIPRAEVKEDEEESKDEPIPRPDLEDKDPTQIEEIKEDIEVTAEDLEEVNQIKETNNEAEKIDVQEKDVNVQEKDANQEQNKGKDEQEKDDNEEQNKKKGDQKKGPVPEDTKTKKGAKKDRLTIDDLKPKKRRKASFSALETETLGDIDDDVFGEEEEEETEMTEEEKESMYNAIRNGEYVLFQDCLDKKNADINMTWYNENLLMAALRSNQIIMAEFLIDNGIDVNFTTTLLELHKNKTRKRFQRYKLSCRQLAYDLGHLDIVEQIDVKNNNLHKFYKVTPRRPRIRRPPAPPAPLFPWEIVEEEEDDDEFSDEEEMFGTTQQETTTLRSALAQTNSARTKIDSDVIETDPYYSTMVDIDVPDEGYGTVSPVSPAPSPVKSLRTPKEDRPGILRRGTRSSLTRENYNAVKYRKSYSKSADHAHALGRQKQSNTALPLLRQKSDVSYNDASVESGFFYNDAFSVSKHSNNVTNGSENTKIHHTSSGGFEIRRSILKPRPFSSPASPLAQVTKILNQSKLLKGQSSELGLPYIKTGKQDRFIPHHVVTPWCHSNSSGVYEQLSNTKIYNTVMENSMAVNRQLYSRQISSAKR